MRHLDAQRRKPATAVKEESQLCGQPALTAITRSGPGGGKRTTATGVIHVLIVDDHTLLREGLRQLLELEEDIKVAGEAADGFAALDQIRQYQPDVILMDIRLPVMDGIALTRQISEQ